MALPLKEGYRHVDDVILAGWQREAPECHHLTEVQAFGVGEGIFLGLPGEPFVSFGTEIRARSGSRRMLIAALANEFGAVSYIAEREAFEQGGYETAFTPVGPDGGEALVDGAVELLERNVTLRGCRTHSRCVPASSPDTIRRCTVLVWV